MKQRARDRWHFHAPEKANLLSALNTATLNCVLTPCGSSRGRGAETRCLFLLCTVKIASSLCSAPSVPHIPNLDAGFTVALDRLAP